MLNFLRPFFARLFNPIGQALARTPITPNMITVAGTVGVCASTLALFPIGWLFPGAAIMLSVLGLNLMGDGLRDLLDPRLAPER